MPQISATTRVSVPPGTAFAVSQTTGDVRMSWDPFVRQQYFLEGAEHAGKDVRTFTKSRHGLTMVSRYVSYNPPTNVGITMERGPWFLEKFAAGWRFTPDGDGTLAVWKYTYTVRPSWLRFIGEPLGSRILGRDIQRRIQAFARACQDPTVLATLDER